MSKNTVSGIGLISKKDDFYFKWSDKLVKEFISKYFEDPATSERAQFLQKQLDDFKSSKAKEYFKDDPFF